MSDGSSKRRVRHSRPGVESLEGRQLMSADTSGISALASTSATALKSTPGALKEFDYTTPQGAHVKIHLYGLGDLTGTYLDGDGALNLRFSGTNQSTGIIAQVHGGTGHALLRSIQHRFIPAQSLSGIGSTLLNVVNLKDFDLVPGGRINLTGGVHLLFLNSAASNTQVSLRELPESAQNTGTSASSTQNGVTYGFLIDLSGAQTLTSIGGSFIPGFSVLPSNAGSLQNTNPPPGPPPAPPGVVVSINHINGPARNGQTIGNPQIFAYDTTTAQLVRFDVATGKSTLTIDNALHGSNPKDAGVALGRDNGNLDVLVSDGSTVYAYNAVSGAPDGSFSLAPLKAAPYSLANPTRLGTYDSFTVVGDAMGGTTGLGKLQAINVTLSLLTGQATVLTDPATGNPVVPSYTSQNGFQFTGGFTGLPGQSTLYAAGAAHFNQFQPQFNQIGIATLTPDVPTSTTSGAGLRETSRAALTGNTTPGTTNPGAGYINTDAKGVTVPNQGVNLPAGNPNNALGYVDLNFALDNGVVFDGSTGQLLNRLSLYSTSFARKTTVNLYTGDTLSGITGSFRPELTGAALVDVQGNTQSLRAHDAHGLVFNGEGYVYLAKIQTAVDSTIIGFPFVHAQIPVRVDTAILSSARSVAGRNNVQVISSLQPTGPLSLPGA